MRWTLAIALVGMVWTSRGMAQFDQFLNLPADGNLPDYFEIPHNTQVNVHGGSFNPDTQTYDYGRIGYDVVAGNEFEPANIEINLYGPQAGEDYGGEINTGLNLYDGATLNVHGGTVYGDLWAYQGAQVHLAGGNMLAYNYLDPGSHLAMSGGTIGMEFSYYSTNGMVSPYAVLGGLRAYGSTILLEGGVLLGDYYLDYDTSTEVRGDQFRLNGEAIPALGGTGDTAYAYLEPGDLLTGILADGTPLTLKGENALGELLLSVAPIPDAGPDTLLVASFSDEMPSSVRDGQTLTVTYQYAGLYSYRQDSPLVVGGGGTANLEAGYFDPIGGVLAMPDSNVNVSGDVTISTLWADHQSEVEITGGRIDSLYVRSGSRVTLAGGTVYGVEASQEGGSLELVGGNFRIDGSVVPILGGPGDTVMVDLAPGEVLTGELADGRPFMLYGGDQLADGVLSLTSNAPAAPDETALTVSTQTTLDHSRDGQTVDVVVGGRLPYRFRAGYGSRINFDGGTSEYLLDALGGSEVVVSSGNLDTTIYASAQSQVSVEGGSLRNVQVLAGGSFAIAGGKLNTGFVEGEAKMSGGSVGRFYVYNDGEITVSGGALDLLQLAPGATATLVGSSFQVGGVDVTSLLSTATPYVVAARDVLFEGILADGTTVGDHLASVYTDASWYAHSGATLQLLLAPPTQMLVGDYNDDGTVDAADYVLWRNNLGTANELANDPIGGMITTDHYMQWKEHFGQSLGGAGIVAAAEQVPEPQWISVFLAFAVATFLLRRRP